MDKIAELGLWDFALKLYAAPGVSEACLDLQENSGTDVPVLLFAAWLSSRGVPLAPEDAQRIDEVVRAWRVEVIQPLRTVRRRLKSGPAPAPTADTEMLRNKVKAVELSAEKIELAVLEDHGEAMMAEGRPTVAGDENLMIVVRHYRPSAPDAPTLHAIKVLAEAQRQL